MAVLTKGARLLLFALLFAGGPGLRADTAPGGEYRIKAVLVFNFAHFVQWPADALPDEEAPLIIGVLGQDPFGSLLDEAVRGEKVEHHPLVVQRYRRIADVHDCQILFISRSENEQLDEILAALKGRRILTVGETDGFGGSGGMISFVTARNKIRLKINVGAARAADLTISSKLLRPAEIVATQKDER